MRECPLTTSTPIGRKQTWLHLLTWNYWRVWNDGFDNMLFSGLFFQDTTSPVVFFTPSSWYLVITFWTSALLEPVWTEKWHSVYLLTPNVTIWDLWMAESVNTRCRHNTLKTTKRHRTRVFFFFNILYCKGVDRLRWLLLMCTKIADGATNCSRMVIFLQKRNYVWCHCGQCLWVSLTCQENKYLGMRHHFLGLQVLSAVWCTCSWVSPSIIHICFTAQMWQIGFF